MKPRPQNPLRLAVRSSSLLGLCSISFCVLSAGHALAQATWDGGGTADVSGNFNWNDGNNWLSDTAPTGGILNFGGNTNTTTFNNNVADTTFTGINFTNDGTTGKTNGFTLGGQAITLGGSITTTTPTVDGTIVDTINLDLILNADRSMTVNRSSNKIHNLTVNGEISGNFTLTKLGNAFLTLTDSANSFTGLTVGGASNGALIVTSIADSGVNSAIGSGSLITFSGGTLEYKGSVAAQTNRSISLTGSGGSIQNNATGGFSIEVNGVVTNDSTGNKTFALGGNVGVNNIFAGNLANNVGTLSFLKNGTSTWVLGGNNTYTGTTTIDAGTVSISKIADSGTETNLGTTGNIQMGFGNGGAALNFTGGGGSTARQVGIGKFNGLNGGGGATISSNGNDGGTGLRFTNSIFNLQENSTNTSTRSLTLSGSNTDANEIGGMIQNAVNSVGTNTALKKTGTGRWILGGANSYTGATSVEGGVLQLNNVSALGGANLTLSGGILGLGAGDFTRVLGTGAGQVQITSGAVSGFAAYGADRAVNFGGSGAMVTWTSGGFFASGSNTMVLSHATATHTLDFQNAIDLNGFPRTFDVANGAAGIDAKLSGVVSGVAGVGPASLVKAGLGTLEMSATGNSYTGETSVNAGKLLVTGTIIDSAVTVNNAGTILATDAAATIGDSLVLNNGAILAVGDAGNAATATATVLGATTFNNGSIFSWDINGTGSGYDKLVTTGLVDGNAAGGTVFRIVAGDATFSDTFWSTNQTWNDIFTTNGSAAIANWATVFGNTVTVVNSSFASITPSAGTFSISGSSLTWAAVPEPTSALAGLLVGAGLLRRRRA